MRLSTTQSTPSCENIPSLMPRLRFGLFDFDPASGELRREGVPVRLQAQPAQVLATRPGPSTNNIAVCRFDNQTGDPALDRFTDALADNVVAELTTAEAGRFGVIGNAAILRVPRSQRDLKAIASALHTEYVVFGQ